MPNEKTQVSYSVVIPAYNASGTLANAIESALAQTVAPVEIVVVDDGSSDDTSAVSEKYAPRVRTIRQINAGPGAARNRGILETTGEWVAFLDADDTWLPRKMERQLVMTSIPEAGVIHATGNPIHSDNNRFAPSRITFDDMWRANFITLSSAIVRRVTFDSVGRFDEHRDLIGVEDRNLWLRIAASPWLILTWPENLVRYTPAPGNLSSQQAKFARAALANFRSLGIKLGLDPVVTRRKLLDIHIEYGRNLLNERDLRGARAMLSGATLFRSTRALPLWVATFVPTKILNLRRRLRDRTRTSETTSQANEPVEDAATSSSFRPSFIEDDQLRPDSIDTNEKRDADKVEKSEPASVKE